jgi:hypothetical protein
MGKWRYKMTNQDLIKEFSEKYNLSFTAKKDLEILIYAVNNNNNGVYVPCFMCGENKRSKK